MPLDLGGGGFNSIRWMASTRSWRSGDDDVDLDKAIFDLENIKQGWVLLAQGEAPEAVWDNGKRGPRPDGDGDWKRGFEVQVYAPKLFGDEEPRAFMTNATGACMGLQSLFVEFEAQSGANTGKVPLVKFTGAEAAKVGKGNTAIPKLAVEKWVDRPDALTGNAAADAAADEPPQDDVEF